MSVKSSLRNTYTLVGTKRQSTGGALSEMPARMKEEDLQDEEALQGWFNTRIENYLAPKGKSLVGMKF